MSATPVILSEDLSRAAVMLVDAQRMVDDGLELAALIVALADGKGRTFLDPKRPEYLARGIIASRSLVGLASYLTDPAMKDGKPTRAGLLRYEVAVFDTELSVPVGTGPEAREDALAAWYKMIEAGVAVGQALAKERA